MRTQLNFSSLDELPQIAKAVLATAEGRKVFALQGEMGAGKTTLIKELCRQLGSRDNFSSPTYSIVNEYLIEGSTEKIYHIDLYRIRNLEEALEIGIRDYLAGDIYCFIEWPGLIEDFLPADRVKLQISIENNMREISIFTR